MFIKSAQGLKLIDDQDIIIPVSKQDTLAKNSLL